MREQNVDINRLIGEFMDLQERWSDAPAAFDWAALQALAAAGATAYNEGAGPSFHMLALDGVEHGEFHERFLGYLLEAGFDPFKLARTGAGDTVIPVLGHTGLAEAAQWNPASARMRAALMEIARQRFGPLLANGAAVDDGVRRIIEACVESIPLDLLEQVAPELARSAGVRAQPVNGAEGWLSKAEVMADNISETHG